MSARLAVVPSTGPDGASARYRALQHVERLRRDADVDVLLPREGPAHPTGPGAPSRARFFAAHLHRYADRARELGPRLADRDAVLVQRGVYRMGPGVAVRAIERFDGRVVFDLDDDVFSPSPTLAAGGRATRWLYGPEQARRLLRRADAVVVSTEALAEAVAPIRTPDAVLPTVPDPARYPVRRHEDRVPATIGWVGNAGNLPHLAVAAPALAALAAAGVAELEVVSSAPWAGGGRFRRWTLDAETDDLLRFDVGVMPLLDGPYAAAKAGFKLLQYLAAGLPVVASPVGVNVAIVEGSGAGALARTAADWERELGRLAADPGLRAELGRRGRAWIERYADLDAQAATLRRLLTEARCGS
jgi:glycosyltransferase involved in cell wall biosynthesis